MLHGNARHDGFVSADIKPPFQLAWARHFAGERLGTAMEPIVANGNVFVATHSGKVYALDARTGDAKWGFGVHGPFLHSPAWADKLVVAACTDGNLYALEAESGRLRWSFFGAYGGFSASPTISDGAVFIGTRGGDFLAVALKTGKELWRQRPLTPSLSPGGGEGVRRTDEGESNYAPIRQTAAFVDGRVFATAEDLRVRCFEAKSGKIIWTSAQLAGQTARDYYPIIVKVGGRTYVVVRTNPVINMGQRIARDRHLLAQNAGFEHNDWKKVDAWTKSEAARGNPELWEKEQKAIIDYLDEHREARSFFVLDAETGKEAMTAPVLWVAGCQGVGAMPAQTTDGRLLVFYRSAYGNWNHGVAPLVTLGLFDLTKNRITPLFHQYGIQPAWNTFWGTADESQNFVVAGNTALIVHQGTLSGFDLEQSTLFPIQGERDTFGGFRSPPWARNEWHGPGRGGVAVVGHRIYWITGSRVLCLMGGESGGAADDVSINGMRVQTTLAPKPRLPTKREIKRRLADEVSEALTKRWAPLFVDPGLAGRDFSFDHSGELFEAVAWAYPHLPRKLQMEAKALLADEWTKHPPFTKDTWYSLKDGQRRELFRAPDEAKSRLGQDKPHQPFGNVYSAWLYAERCGQWEQLRVAWPQIKIGFDEFHKSGWRLDETKGDLYANRYLASLIAVGRIAEKAGDSDTANQAGVKAAETTEALAAWWNRAAEDVKLSTFRGSAELDPFIGGGNAISFRIAPHRHKVALFHDLTPEVAALIRSKAADAAAKVWEIFQTLYPTWP
ncbi:MAG TPA: PQQ-binding-like beta-propeller repeat protein, partial [Verrucomicrobiae bacterium]|nr:PQQ-binding-like beta-propeller repeat protein [Verrucomicrobiae bacterium]